MNFQVNLSHENIVCDESGQLKPTLSALLVTVRTQQSKLISKDQLIQCLADQLISLANSGCCWKNSLLECIACYPSRRCVDFDCALLLDYLGGFISFTPVDVSVSFSICFMLI